MKEGNSGTGFKLKCREVIRVYVNGGSGCEVDGRRLQTERNGTV